MTTTRNLDFNLDDIKLAKPSAAAADAPLVGAVLQRTNSPKNLTRGAAGRMAATAGVFALLAAAAAGAAFLASRPDPAAPPRTAAQPAPAPTPATPAVAPAPAGPLASDTVSEPAPPVRRIRTERELRHAVPAGAVEAPADRAIRVTPEPEPVTPAQPAAQAPATAAAALAPLDQPAAPQPPASQPATAQAQPPQPQSSQPQPQAPPPQSSPSSPQT